MYIEMYIEMFSYVNYMFMLESELVQARQHSAHKHRQWGVLLLQ